MGEIVAALATTHAPQLLIRPKETEDPEEVARVHEAMRQLGARLDASRAQTLVVFAMDHLENYLDQVVAPFIVYTGDDVEGSFGPYRPRYKVDTELAERVLREGIGAGFDLAYSQNTLLDHSFIVPLHFIHPANRLPIVPIIVNVYLAPQPSAARCFQLGAALRDILLRSGRRVALLASGGMSHYPGTPKYPHPNFDFDRALLRALERGEGSRLREMTSVQLDEAGNVELRTWMVVMGIIGAERPATVVTYEPCWHHGHGVLYWELERSVGGTAG
jgi:protocatechuate 4,5-dioxygenase beta chain/2,3-dihydroxyphenylpropionate 1,2-dioxygenase